MPHARQSEALRDIFGEFDYSNASATVSLGTDPPTLTFSIESTTGFSYEVRALQTSWDKFMMANLRLVSMQAKLPKSAPVFTDYACSEAQSNV